MADLIRGYAELALRYAACRAGHRAGVEAHDAARRRLGAGKGD